VLSLSYFVFFCTTLFLSMNFLASNTNPQYQILNIQTHIFHPFISKHNTSSRLFQFLFPSSLSSLHFVSGRKGNNFFYYPPNFLKKNYFFSHRLSFCLSFITSFLQRTAKVISLYISYTLFITLFLYFFIYICIWLKYNFIYIHMNIFQIIEPMQYASSHRTKAEIHPII
jgi:hypothetical protein